MNIIDVIIQFFENLFGFIADLLDQIFGGIFGGSN